MTTSMLSYHDGFFKHFMSDICLARDFLHQHLPPAVLYQCDLSTLTMTSGSFVEPELRQHCSDMLYRVKASGTEGYIYCLIEHQSRPQAMMAFRMMRYCLAAMKRHLDQGNDYLPLVVPLLLYHGRQSPYPYSCRWLDCFHQPELAAAVYNSAFPLADITTLDDRHLLKHGTIGLLQIIQRDIFIRDLIDLLPCIKRIMSVTHISNDLKRSLIYYICAAGNTKNLPRFIHLLVQQTPQHQEDIMTVAEQLRKEGREQGLQQGLEQGLEQGRREGRLERQLENSMRIAHILIAHQTDAALIKAATGLTDAEIAKLSR